MHVLFTYYTNTYVYLFILFWSNIISYHKNSDSRRNSIYIYLSKIKFDANLVTKMWVFFFFNKTTTTTFLFII